jgi:hypothetical protein
MLPSAPPAMPAAPRIAPPPSGQRGAAVAAAPAPMGLDGMLTAIRGGTTLRKVDPSAMANKAPAADDGSVLNLIAKALLDRREAMKNDTKATDKDDDDAWGDDLEW